MHRRAPLVEFAPWPNTNDDPTIEADEEIWKRRERRAASRGDSHVFTNFMTVNTNGDFSSRPRITGSTTMNADKHAKQRICRLIKDQREVQEQLIRAEVATAIADPSDLQGGLDRANADAVAAHNNYTRKRDEVLTTSADLSNYNTYQNASYALRSQYTVNMVNVAGRPEAELQVRQTATNALCGQLSLGHNRKMRRALRKKRREESGLLDAYYRLANVYGVAQTANEARKRKILSDKEMRTKWLALALNYIAAEEDEPMQAHHQLQRRLRMYIKLEMSEAAAITKLFVEGYAKYEMKESEADLEGCVRGSNGGVIEYLVSRANDIWAFGLGSGRQTMVGVCGRFEARTIANDPSSAQQTYIFGDNPNSPTDNTFGVGSVDFVVKDCTLRQVVSKVWDTLFDFRQRLQQQIANRVNAGVLRRLKEAGFMECGVTLWTLNADLVQKALIIWAVLGFKISSYQHESLSEWVELHKEEVEADLWGKHGEKSGMKTKVDMLERALTRILVEGIDEHEPFEEVMKLQQDPYCEYLDKQAGTFLGACTFMYLIEQVEGKEELTRFLQDPLIRSEMLTKCRHFKALCHQLDNDFLDPTFHCNKLCSLDIVLRGFDPEGLHMPNCHHPIRGFPVPKPYGKCTCEMEHICNPVWYPAPFNPADGDTVDIEHPGATSHYREADVRRAVIGRQQFRQLQPIPQGRLHR